LTFGPLHASGALPAAAEQALDQLFEEHRARLLRCYDDRLASVGDRDLVPWGKVEVEIRKGSVPGRAEVRLAGTTVNDRMIEDCITAELRSWVWPVDLDSEGRSIRRLLLLSPPEG
jgi:hypothetical protein